MPLPTDVVYPDDLGAGESLPVNSILSSKPVDSTAFEVLAVRADRKGAIVDNDSSFVLYLALSSTLATISLYSVKLPPRAHYELPFPTYLGRITGIFDAPGPSAGAARITELY